MDILQRIAEFEIVGNKLWRLMALFGIIFIALLIGKIAKFSFKKSAQRFEKGQHLTTATTLNAVSQGIIFLFGAIGISLGIFFLDLKENVAEFFNTLCAIFFSLAVGYMIYWLVEVPTQWLKEMAGRSESRLDHMIVPIIRKSLRITVIILLGVQIAQILSDKPITSIIAGLGIGGLAFALAAQDTLKNFFGSVVLFTDKPFEMGDRVVIDGHDGQVEEVGLRSTKIRTMEGHLVTVPNGELANKTIQNIGKRPHIRRIVDLAITYDTPLEKIDLALEIVKELLENHEGKDDAYPPRVFFNEFNSASLNIRVMYWYHPPNYWGFMAFSEKFNKEVFRRFNEASIDFAFPTQTLYVAEDASRPITIGLRNQTKTG